MLRIWCESVRSLLVCVSVRTWGGDRNSIDASRLEGETTLTGRDEWDKEFDRGKVRCLFAYTCIC